MTMILKGGDPFRRELRQALAEKQFRVSSLAKLIAKMAPAKFSIPITTAASNSK